ncbi:hypothetical protein PTKIN_Ptkin14bG0035600 [Pterospermum kingtungense]
MLISRVLSRVSRTAGARSLLLNATKELKTPSFATQFHSPLKFGGSSAYPVFMQHAALSSSPFISRKPNLEKTSSYINHLLATMMEEAERMDLLFQQLEGHVQEREEVEEMELLIQKSKGNLQKVKGHIQEFKGHIQELEIYEEYKVNGEGMADEEIEQVELNLSEIIEEFRKMNLDLETVVKLSRKSDRKDSKLFSNLFGFTVLVAPLCIAYNLGVFDV